jgi:hypothetical protein
MPCIIVDSYLRQAEATMSEHSRAQAPIHSEMSIPEIVEQFPKTEAVFARHGIQVSGYKAIEFETLFATARVHQLPLQPLIDELNRAVHDHA